MTDGQPYLRCKAKPMDKSYFNNLELLIAGSQVDELVTSILNNFEADFLGELKNNLLLLSSQYNKATKDRALNLVDYKEYSQDQARITNAFILVLGELKKKWADSQSTPVAPPASAAAPTVAPVNSGAITDTSTRSVEWLEQLMQRTRNVCHILLPSDGTMGTGIYLGKGWLLTNHHVLPSTKEITEGIVRFFYDKQTADGDRDMLSVRLSPEGFVTDEKLNFTFARLMDGDGDMARIETIPDFPLATAAPAAGDMVSLIHHPLGGIKKIDLMGEIITVEAERTIYRIFSQPGSSGGAVLNANHELLGVHTGRAPNQQMKYFLPIQCMANVFKSLKISE